jgi:ubiquinol-cytochrome c reductase cytochrome b subunit
VISFIALGWLGTQPATEIYTWFARGFAALYFGYFVFLFFYSRMEATKPVPDRVTFKH